MLSFHKQIETSHAKMGLKPLIGRWGGKPLWDRTKGREMFAESRSQRDLDKV